MKHVICFLTYLIIKSFSIIRLIKLSLLQVYMINLLTWRIYNPTDFFIQNQILNESNMG